MGASANSSICLGECVHSDNESNDHCPKTLRYSTDLMTASAINGGSSWEQAAKISWNTPQDFRITVSLLKTDTDLSWVNKSSVSTKVKVMKAKQLLFQLSDGKYIDQRRRKKSGKTSEQKQTRNSICKSVQQKHLNKVQCQDSIKSSPEDSTLETYDLILPSWSDTWRLKCTIAQLSGIPARDQFLLCNSMTAESALEHNYPAASLSDLPVNYKPPEKTKSKLFPGRLSFNFSGEKMSDSKRFTTTSSVSHSTHLNLVICVPRLPLCQLSSDKAPSIDSSDNSSKGGASCPLASESSDRGQPELQSIVDSNDNSDSSQRIMANKTHMQPEKCEVYKSAAYMPKKEPDGVLHGLVPKCRGQSVAYSIEDFALENWSDGEVEPCALNEGNDMDQAELVFLKMKMLTAGKADLIQVMVGLTRLGCERPTLGQARMLFESVGCRITDCITPDHIRIFLESRQQGEDTWLSNVREMMASVQCDSGLVK